MYTSPAAREPISAAILLNLFGKRRLMIKDVKVSTGRESGQNAEKKIYHCRHC
jgi:hypothetical protein